MSAVAEGDEEEEDTDEPETESEASASASENGGSLRLGSSGRLPGSTGRLPGSAKSSGGKSSESDGGKPSTPPEQQRASIPGSGSFPIMAAAASMLSPTRSSSRKSRGESPAARSATASMTSSMTSSTSTSTSSSIPRTESAPRRAFFTEKDLPDLVLGKRLGKGSFGDVFRGEWQGRSVAVKVMRFAANTETPDQKSLANQLIEDFIQEVPFFDLPLPFH